MEKAIRRHEMLRLVRTGIQKKMLESRIKNNSAKELEILNIIQIAERGGKEPKYKFEKIIEKYQQAPLTNIKYEWKSTYPSF